VLVNPTILEVTNPSPTNENHQSRTGSLADGRKVTRSTSPIDEKIIRTIFVEDANPNRKNSTSFTIPVQSSRPVSSSSSSPAGQGKRSLQSASLPTPTTAASSSKKPSLEQFLQSRLAHSSPPLDPSHPNYYGELIRERLKMILNRNRRGSQPQQQAAHPVRHYDNDDNDEEEEEGEGEQDYYPPAPVVPGVPRRRRGSGGPSREQRGNNTKLDETQLYTRDMMASMATIMTAVGGILTNTNQKQFWASQKRKWQSKSNYHHHNNNNNKEEITEQEAEAMTKILTSDLDDGRKHNNNNKNNNKNSIPSSVLSSIPNKPLNLQTRAGTKDFLLEMSDFIQKKEELPKNKSKVVDMIMQKLQVSESKEFSLIFPKFIFSFIFILVH
jgi:hypothetical protein